MYKKIFIAFALISLIVSILLLERKNTGTQKVIIGNNKVIIHARRADSERERAQGYSNHPPITYQEGMLFIFPTVGMYAFWMQDMSFDLDFLFIENNVIVDIKTNIPAPIHNDGEIEYIMATTPFDKALEVKAGFVKKYKIKRGDVISY